MYMLSETFVNSCRLVLCAQQVTNHHQHILAVVYKSSFSIKIYPYAEEIQSQIKKM